MSRARTLGAGAWWAGRSPRERWLLAGLAAMAAAYVAVVVVAQPLLAARA